MSSTILAPFQLLELNIISAQDLSPVSRSMRAYAVAWVHPNRKLSTRVDANGRNNPTWNDKFVFRVDDDFLQNDTSAVMIEIFALHWLRDVHVGTVRVLVGNLIPPPAARSINQSHRSLGMRFVALQVRRPSGTPQGILNIGVALLDSSMRSMPLYTQLSSAVGYRHLMGEEDPFAKNTSTVASTYQNNVSFMGKSDLRRTKSDTSSMIGSEIARKSRIRRENGNGKARSMVSGSEISEKKNKNKNKKESVKGSSVFSGSDIFKKPSNKVGNSDLSGSDIMKHLPGKDNAGKVRSLVNGIENLGSPTKGKIGKGGSMIGESDSSDPPRKVDSPKAKSPSKSFARDQGYKFEFPSKLKLYRNLQPVITQSELGPSPSEVAAAKAKEKFMKQTNDEESSVVITWDMESSVEGLQSKLDRWRAELPPLYDASFPSSSSSGRGGGGGTTGRHSRRHTDGGSGPGLFSCFSNVGGCECSIVCGSVSPNKKGKKKSGSSGRLIRSPLININSSFS